MKKDEYILIYKGNKFKGKKGNLNYQLKKNLKYEKRREVKLTINQV